MANNVQCRLPALFEVTMGTVLGRAMGGGWKMCGAHALALIAGELPQLTGRERGYSIAVDVLEPHRMCRCQSMVEP